MRRSLYELNESLRIAAQQIAANKTRSALTALGVIIGIVAVTLMGAAVSGIDRGFEQSLSVIGDDVLYVSKWPWGPVDDWWDYRNRSQIRVDDAATLQRIIDEMPHSLLGLVVPSVSSVNNVKYGDYQVNSIFTLGTTAGYIELSRQEFEAGRFFSELESRSGRNVCVIGNDVARALFPAESPLGKAVRLRGQEFRVVGVFTHQGSFLGLFSLDSQVVLPLTAFRRYFVSGGDDNQYRIKVIDKARMADARDELTGAMRRVRGLQPGEKDDFSVNEQQAFRSTIDPIKTAIAGAGLFITGLSLFVGAIGIMNITFVSVKERTKEIGTRKALGARRSSILLQFLIEAVSICLLGGVVGLALAFGVFLVVARVFESFPITFSPGLVLVALAVSVLTGIFSGFVPAWSAARLDPVVALRYE